MVEMSNQNIQHPPNKMKKEKKNTLKMCRAQNTNDNMIRDAWKQNNDFYYMGNLTATVFFMVYSGIISK